MEKIINLWKSKPWVKLLAGLTGGSILGFAYFYFIGCRTGTCAITSNPVNSTLYGAVMGLIFTFPSKRESKK